MFSETNVDRLGGGRSILLNYEDTVCGFPAQHTRGKRNYTEAAAGLSTKPETNSAQRAATSSFSGP